VRRAKRLSPLFSRAHNISQDCSISNIRTLRLRGSVSDAGDHSIIRNETGAQVVRILRWIPSRLREGRASSAGRARGWGTRSGRKADPLRFGARDDSVGRGHPKRRGNGCRAEGPATTLKTKKAKSRSLVTTFLVMTPKTTAKGPGPATGKHVAAPWATRAAAARHTPPAFATACGSKVIASKLR
jgi:hypothetical protein